MGNLTGITFPLYMRVGLDSASLQSSRSCLHAGAWWGWGCGSKVIDSEPNFLLGIRYEFGECDHFLG